MPRHVSDDTTIVVEVRVYEESRIGVHTYEDHLTSKIQYKGSDLAEADRIFQNLTKGENDYSTINTRTSS